MDVSQILTDQGLSFALGVVFVLALLRGDLVTRREYREVVDDRDALAAKAEATAKEQAADTAAERAESRETIARLTEELRQARERETAP